MSLEPDLPDEYVVGHVEEALATDPRVNEQGLHVEVAGGKVFVTGSVSTSQRKSAVSDVVGELVPGAEVHNDASVSDFPEPAAVERLT